MSEQQIKALQTLLKILREMALESTNDFILQRALAEIKEIEYLLISDLKEKRDKIIRGSCYERR